MKRIAHKVEPVLKVHRYVAVVYNNKGKATYHYVMNRKEVRDVKMRLKRGNYMEVFKADHNFVSAWFNE